MEFRLWMRTGQTKDDETHVIWPVAGRLAALSDHAELPVIMPREFDEDMRRDGSLAAFMPPKHLLAEREVHGEPQLSCSVASCIATRGRVELSSKATMATSCRM